MSQESGTKHLEYFFGLTVVESASRLTIVQLKRATKSLTLATLHTVCCITVALYPIPLYFELF